MYFGDDTVRETVSVMGTPAFMDFVESIQSEGVTFERVTNGRRLNARGFAHVEVDTENEEKTSTRSTSRCATHAPLSSGVQNLDGR